MRTTTMKAGVAVLLVVASYCFCPITSYCIRNGESESSSPDEGRCLQKALTENLQSTIIALADFLCVYDITKDGEDKADLVNSIENLENVTGCTRIDLLGSDATLEELQQDVDGTLKNLIRTALKLMIALKLEFTSTPKCGLMRPILIRAIGRLNSLFPPPIHATDRGNKRHTRDLSGLLGLLGGLGGVASGLGDVTGGLGKVTGGVGGMVGGLGGLTGLLSGLPLLSGLTGNLLGGSDLLGGLLGQRRGPLNLGGLLGSLTGAPGELLNLGGLFGGSGGPLALLGGLGNLGGQTGGLLDIGRLLGGVTGAVGGLTGVTPGGGSAGGGLLGGAVGGGGRNGGSLLGILG